MKLSSRARFLFLSDISLKLIDLFGIRHETGNLKIGNIARSALFLVSSDGKVRWIRVANNYRARPTVDEILAAVDAVSSK